MSITAIHPPFRVGGYAAKATPAKEGLRMSDVAQRMWTPMLGMGAMLLIGGLALGIVSAVRVDDILGLSDRRFYEVVSNGFLPPVLFLGLGFLLSGVTFLLATILGTLRDGGRDIQRAVGGKSIDLVKPLTAKLFPAAMMMGLMVLIAGVAVGIVVAVLQGGYFGHSAAAVANGPATPALAADLGDIQSLRAWLQPLDFVGMGLILSGIVLALATIVRALRFQAARVVQLGEEAG
jgi:hypothetical protein